MGRRTKEELIEEIKTHLARSPLSINELAEDKLKSNWSTIRDILNLMEKLEIVEIKDPKSKIKIYQLKKIKPKKRKDTFFGLPITKQEESILHYLFSKIKKLFLKNLERTPKDTEAQKTAVDVALACKLKIPIGWYLFGMITVMRYEDSYHYQSVPISCDEEKIDKEILKSIEYCKKFKYVRELAKKQYEKFENKLYLAKLYLAKEQLKKISNLRLNLNDENSRKIIQKLLSTFLFYLPTKEDAEEIIEIVTDYVSIMNRLLISEIYLNQLRYDLSDAFEAIWRYVATYCFFDSVTETGNYDRKKTYEDFFKSSLDDRKEIALEYMNNLEQLIPKDNEIPILELEKEGADIIRQTYEEMSKETR